MKLNELRLINRTIKEETLRYCRGMIPSLDEVGELVVILAEKTCNMAQNPHKINSRLWVEAVYAVVKGVILEEVA